LEPCNHYGKTPPCTDRIIKEKFSRVVIGIMDSNKIVIGKGAKKLRQAGILVETGIMKDEINIINEVFIKYITTKQPFCAMKTAMSFDGKISTYTGNSKWISNEKSRKWVHELRHRYSGIMVGVNTIIKDDPDLTDRSDYEIKKHPVRIVLDSNGRTPLNSKILNTSYAKTIIAVTENANSKFIKSVNKNGAKVIICPEKDNRVNLSYLMNELGKQSIDSILLEGGSTLNFSALKEGVVDKIFSFIAPKLIGGDTSKTPVGGLGFDSLEKAISLNIKNIKRFDQDILVEAYII
jgi:diaminohydroxyphosphoribosylaminopyrimidine deaminase/5-amino-6-(5-phosphoribosylamino)uracil reductase